MEDKSTQYPEIRKPTSNAGRKLMEMFDLLFDHFGPLHWWPGETDLEIMVGAILTQNTNWKNVEKAIRNLRENGLLTVETLYGVDTGVLARAIRPAGYFNVKARRLKNLIAFLMEHYGGDLDLMRDRKRAELREDLLSVKGIGPETADSILLYALGRPVFVVDAYTHRILNRHGMMEDQASYDELQAFFMDHLPEDAAFFNEFHALIVMTGKDFCKRSPDCLRCPLGGWTEPVVEA